MIIRYDSPQALARAYSQLGATSSYGGSRDNWYNGESESQTLSFTLNGNPALVPEAERYLNQLDLAIETPRKVWQRSPAGAFCIVPDVLAGLPTPMRRQHEEPDDKAPITILVCTTSSAGIDSKTLEKRGTIILALVMALSRIRPIALTALCMLNGREEGETILTSVINTSPLDLATACYVLTSAGFDRRLHHGISKKLNNFSGGWPTGFNYSKPEPFYKLLVPRLGYDPRHTLIIGSAQLGDELLATPLAWIEKQITRFTQTKEDKDA